jgi:hypothetical protein
VKEWPVVEATLLFPRILYSVHGHRLLAAPSFEILFLPAVILYSYHTDNVIGLSQMPCTLYNLHTYHSFFAVNNMPHNVNSCHKRSINQLMYLLIFFSDCFNHDLDEIMCDWRIARSSKCSKVDQIRSRNPGDLDDHTTNQNDLHVQ